MVHYCTLNAFLQFKIVCKSLDLPLSDFKLQRYYSNSYKIINNMQQYQVLISAQTWQDIAIYLKDLRQNSTVAGAYLKQALGSQSLSAINEQKLLEYLIQTKQPQIFAESAVQGNGHDWNGRELSILGNVAIAVPVTFFDNGLHDYPKVYPKPFDGLLLYSAGALLRNDRGGVPADWNAVVQAGQLDYKGYYALYKQRLLPVLHYANQQATAQQRQALITIPGLGCGMFAGAFKGQLGALLEQVLVDLLEQYAPQLPNIKAVYYDPYNECQNKRYELGGISLMVRPLLQGNEGKGQLSHPLDLQEEGDDFSNCLLCSIVAWDHVSWPGNDFYINARATDDGVKAAATDSMWKMTGIKGHYDAHQYSYLPPKEYLNWDAVVQQQQLNISLEGHLSVLG